MYVRGPVTCRMCGNLNFDPAVFEVSFDEENNNKNPFSVDLVKTLKVILTSFKKLLVICGGLSQHSSMFV